MFNTYFSHFLGPILGPEVGVKRPHVVRPNGDTSVRVDPLGPSGLQDKGFGSEDPLVCFSCVSVANTSLDE